MKLSTLLEYKRCFEMLRKADSHRTPLSMDDYEKVVYAASEFNVELSKIVDPIDVEVEA